MSTRKKSLSRKTLDVAESAVKVMHVEDYPGVRVSEISKKNTLLTGAAETTGWYYDSQLNNNLTSVRLYANSVIEYNENKKNLEWKYSNKSSGEDPYEWEVMHSVLGEDFNVEIQNSWQDYGEDALGTAFTAWSKPVAVYGNVIAKGLEKIKNKHNAKMVSDSEYAKSADSTKIGNAIDSALNSNELQNILNRKEKMNSFLQGALITQGCSFTTYGGTGVSFGNLGMQFTLFPTWSMSGEFISVKEQLDKILPYAIGNLKDISDTEGAEAIGDMAKGAAKLASKATNINFSAALDKVMEAGKEMFGDALNNYVKWQEPPAGYMVNAPMNVDVKGFPGTLKLEIGAHYSIESLVIANMSLRFSKQMVKNPEMFADEAIRTDSDSITATNQGNFEAHLASGGLSPLFCDVNIIFRPITKYSINSLRRFIEGNTKERANLVYDMQDHLISAKEEITSKINSNV